MPSGMTVTSRGQIRLFPNGDNQDVVRPDPIGAVEYLHHRSLAPKNRIAATIVIPQLIPLLFILIMLDPP